MPVFPADYLTQVASALFEAAGASQEEGQIVASSLVEANLAGHDSHGASAGCEDQRQAYRGHRAPDAA